MSASVPGRPPKLLSNACLFCKRRKRKCDGAQPCATCIKYNNADGCEYSSENDRRKKKYDSTHIDYLEVKADLLELHAANLIKRTETLKDFDLSSILPQPPQLTQNNDFAQLGHMGGQYTNINALEEIVSTAWKVRKHGDKTEFYGPLSGRQGVVEDGDENFLNPETELLDIDFCSPQFRERLFNVFEENFGKFFYVSQLTLETVRSWPYPCVEPDHRLLMCSIFAYASAYVRPSITHAFLESAENAAIAACKEALNENTLQGLLILSCFELGMAQDSSSWLFDAMCASQAQYIGLHTGEKLTESSTSTSVVPTSPLKNALFWSIILQDRFITTVLGRGCRIQYFRIMTPFYSPKSSPENIDRYISELTFSFHSRLWYLHDRSTQQIYSFRADYLHNSHRQMLLEQGFSNLRALYESFPDVIMLKPVTKDKRILLLHLSYYVVLLLLHRSYLIQNPKTIIELMVKLCTSASKVTERYSELHGFNNAPYFVGYLLFQCAMFDLFILANKDESFQAAANSQFVKFVAALSEYADVWTRGIKDIKVLDNLARQWNVSVPILDQLRQGSQPPPESVIAQNDVYQNYLRGEMDRDFATDTPVLDIYNIPTFLDSFDFDFA
ncbi:Zn(II)2Cys6 transcription factor [Ogataea polymorpha]|uniref:Uncharacterized protein n=1 Tax=Ogataea polymorpha TaxID=460523 RepID=A0A1B7SR04_9ASCO|nr:Zn(II)2Cys6 transcription factor [Ogataea polymorpha]KAH3659952.1 hypothetical protein OGATHE_005997 [Ogataea polymorpha]OBA18919.1 Zn(II)2Cys6 transcription factor [Ogataea polymorpha]